MSKTKQPEIKKASLSSEELEEITYYLREQNSRQVEVNAWGRLVRQMQAKIAKRLGLDLNLYEIDWSILIEGKISYQKKEVPHVEQAPQEPVVPPVS